MRRSAIGFAALMIVVTAAGVYAKKQKTSAGDERRLALHALERLTFGPRPGDVEAVMAKGVDRWIDLQLHPERIDNGAMQARLSGYRTLQMSTRDIVFSFPPAPVARAVMEGRLPMPADAYRHAIYAAALDRIEQKQEQKQGPTAAENAAATAVKPADLTGQQQLARREAHREINDLIALSPATRMQRILSLPVAQQRDLLQGIPYPTRQALLAGLSPEQRETVVALNHPEAVVDGELQAGKLLRAVYSDRQLEEVLTDFWFNHFNVFIGKGSDRYLVTAYERDVIRPRVLGKFRDLLIATAQSPAMLFYLDNWQSEGPNSDAALGKPGPGPRPYWTRRPAAIYRPRPPQPNPQSNQQQRRSGLNENYARELMELHTLGVNGGYTQHDVTEVARVFTGWTLEQPQQGGGFVFRPRLHEPGDKVVLGHRIRASGEEEGLEVLRLLAHQPATARFISTELAQRFVADNPPQPLVEAMAKTFIASDGDLREVLRTMFHSTEFRAPQAYRSRVKTPFEFVVSSLRATQAEVSDPQPLLFMLNKMGQPLYGSQPPTGYSTRADVWVNSAALLDRMNFGLALATNRLPGASFNPGQLMNSGAASSHAGLASATAPTEAADPYEAQRVLEQVLLAGDVSTQTHDTIEQRVVSPQLAAQAQDAGRPANVNVIAGLLLGSPEFQRK
ncbi:MAG TPA: DUF1800 domain-containing protein [Candidatus Binatia bacterium]|nr:DUF1800 domain-containing protein [Candidatus Binatia bacterium]